MIDYILSPAIVEALGWTLLHSLWQGALFALVLAVLLVALRSYTAQARYTVSVGLLAAFFLTIGSTFYAQWDAAQLAGVTPAACLPVEDQSVDEASMPLIATNANTTAECGTAVAEFAQPVEVSANAAVAPTMLTKMRDYYKDHLPLLVTLWLMGVFVLQLRWLGQLAYVQRLKHYGTLAFPEAWSGRIRELEEKLRIQKTVKYVTTLRASSPMTVGWLKPVVLFPQVMLAKLSDTEIYAVLAHELAHVRRDDFVVNLVQSLLTNVFFFHPGVWWMSHVVDNEREHCCDDMAIAATGEALPYAKSLLTVSELQSSLGNATAPQFAMAFTGRSKSKDTSFSGRVKRLLSKTSGAGTFREGFATAFILLGALGIGVVATGQTGQEELMVSAELDQLQPVTDFVSIENPPRPTPPPSIGNTSTNESIVFSKTLRPIEGINALPQVEEERVTRLIWAASQGRLSEVKEILASGVSVNSVDASGFTALIASISGDEYETAVFLLESDADPNLMTQGWTALMEAARIGSVKVLELLFANGAQVNAFDGPLAPTAVTMAAGEGHLACVKTLQAAGANISGQGQSFPPLHAAAKEGHSAIVAYLLEQGVVPTQHDIYGRTALMYGAASGKQDIIDQLLAAGADPNEMDQQGGTASAYAMAEGFPFIARRLDGLSSLPNTGGNNGKGPLEVDEASLPRIHQYTIAGKMEKVEQMVRNGSNVNQQDRDGRSPMHYAAALDYNLDVRSLIALGADKNMRDRGGRTALMYAAKYGNHQSGTMLISMGADASMADNKGRQALDYAKEAGETDFVKFLELITDKQVADQNRHIDNFSIEGVYNTEEEKQELKELIKEKRRQQQEQFEVQERQSSWRKSQERFPNTNPARSQSDHPMLARLFAAAANGDVNELEQILQAGTNPNEVDEHGETALMAAAMHGEVDAVTVLMKYGAQVNIATSSGLTALHLSALERNAAMVKLLLDNGADVEARMNYSSSDGSPEGDLVAWSFEGATPLLVAIEGNAVAVAKLLLKAGSDPMLRIAKVEYRKAKGSRSYLDRSEVVGENDLFKQSATTRKRIADWTPYQEAELKANPKMLALF